jgi:preprotein translocase subunit SecG
VFGSRGAGNFLSRTTWVLAALFCAISLTMAVLVSRMMESPETGLGVVAETPPAVVAEDQPLVPEDAGESMFSAEEAPVSDVPAFEPAAEDLPAADVSADDLPPAASDEEAPEDPGNG